MKTGVAPNQAMTSAVAANVKVGQRTASPGRNPLAMRISASASVPLAQETTCAAPQKAERSASSCVTSGPMM